MDTMVIVLMIKMVMTMRKCLIDGDRDGDSLHHMDEDKTCVHIVPHSVMTIVITKMILMVVVMMVILRPGSM